MTRVKVIFTTFATEGPPYDFGLPIAESCVGPLIAKVIESGVDEVLAFTPRTMIPVFGEELTRRCTRKLNPPIKVFSENYHNVGAGAWKAEILKKIVETHNDGDIVMFHDSNWLKYPGILTGFAPRARDYATAAMAAASRMKLFAPPSHILIHTVTRNVFERLRDTSVTGHRHTSLIYQPAARARCIVLEINKDTREFVRLFSEACNVDENLQGGAEAWTARGGWSERGFIHNAGEQGILNALVYGRGLWDPKKDDWISQLSNIGSHDRDSGAEALISWATSHRGWKTDR